ncbi:MAG: tryptophan synthase subunit alpha [Xanthomonadales bacterium]|nr:tryptophan synthase subunit alpha [Xanthomonadales bacterium]
MNRRIKACFETASSSGRKVLIPFITAGDPKPEWTVDIMHALVEAGADLLELGVPFSDPMADGPVIQTASERAIENGVTLNTVLDMVAEFRRDDEHTPVVLMGYMNPLERFGRQEFPAAAKAAGVDGLLLVDCPPEERDDLGAAMDDASIDGVCLVAPTTTRERLAYLARHASGFIYYVSLKGITGAGQLDTAELQGPIDQIREFSALPVAVGFGIKTAEMASTVAQFADAVVIGSALVEVLAESSSSAEACAEARAFVAPVRESMDNMAR